MKCSKGFVPMPSSFTPATRIDNVPVIGYYSTDHHARTASKQAFIKTCPISAVRLDCDSYSL